MRAAMFRSIKERILSLNRSSGIHPVLVIDDAHMLCTEIFKEIRLLTNFEIDSYNALTVLLCGQETLTRKLLNLAKEESFSYIEQRINQVGPSSNLFTKNALSLIHQASGGIMRNINTIAKG